MTFAPPAAAVDDYASDYAHDYLDVDVAPTSDVGGLVIPGNDYVAVEGVDQIVKEAEPRLDVVSGEEDEDVDEDYEYNTAPPPLEYHEYRITPDAASPPSPTPLPSLDPNTPYSYPEAPINYDYQQNDVLDGVIGADDDDDDEEEEVNIQDANSLDYAESQTVHGGWNDLQVRFLQRKESWQNISMNLPNTSMDLIYMYRKLQDITCFFFL